MKANSYHFGVNFFYKDFRQGWQKGRNISISKGYYMQKYCGCLFSEQERFDNRLKKRLKKTKIATQEVING